MAYRASFKRCLQMMAFQFRAANYERLHIINHPDAKYYTLIDCQELATFSANNALQNTYLVCSLTIGELNSLMTIPQTDLFGQVTPDGD